MRTLSTSERVKVRDPDRPIDWRPATVIRPVTEGVDAEVPVKFIGFNKEYLLPWKSIKKVQPPRPPPPPAAVDLIVIDGSDDDVPPTGHAPQAPYSTDCATAPTPVLAPSLPHTTASVNYSGQNFASDVQDTQQPLSGHDPSLHLDQQPAWAPQGPSPDDLYRVDPYANAHPELYPYHPNNQRAQESQFPPRPSGTAPPGDNYAASSYPNESYPRDYQQPYHAPYNSQAPPHPAHPNGSFHPCRDHQPYYAPYNSQMRPLPEQSNQDGSYAAASHPNEQFSPRGDHQAHHAPHHSGIHPQPEQRNQQITQPSERVKKPISKRAHLPTGQPSDNLALPNGARPTQTSSSRPDSATTRPQQRAPSDKPRTARQTQGETRLSRNPNESSKVLDMFMKAAAEEKAPADTSAARISRHPDTSIFGVPVPRAPRRNSADVASSSAMRPANHASMNGRKSLDNNSRPSLPPASSQKVRGNGIHKLINDDIGRRLTHPSSSVRTSSIRQSKLSVRAGQVASSHLIRPRVSEFQSKRVRRKKDAQLRRPVDTWNLLSNGRGPHTNDTTVGRAAMSSFETRNPMNSDKKLLDEEDDAELSNHITLDDETLNRLDFLSLIHNPAGLYLAWPVRRRLKRVPEKRRVSSPNNPPKCLKKKMQASSASKIFIGDGHLKEDGVEDFTRVYACSCGARDEPVHDIEGQLGSIQCGMCGLWSHLRCMQLTEVEIDIFCSNERRFLCWFCLDRNLPLVHCGGTLDLNSGPWGFPLKPILPTYVAHDDEGVRLAEALNPIRRQQLVRRTLTDAEREARSENVQALLNGEVRISVGQRERTLIDMELAQKLLASLLPK